MDPLVVLAVDDDSLVLMNTIAMLEDLGHRVFPATSARDALSLLRNEKVDLIITDYAMPDTNGIELAQAVHRRYPDVPVILVTGYAELPAESDEDLPRLAKPFLQQDLARTIWRVAGGDTA
ncbi:MAG TPA: response regulator, partial [Caulobacteraceae bacterium]|nr:response regulator [Caulobacteraceae bacterium]